MHKPNSNVDIIKDFYFQFKNQNKQSYRDLIDDNIEWITMECMPNGGRYIGKSEVFERYFPAMLSNFKEFHAIADEYSDLENGNVLVLGRYAIKTKKHNHDINIPFAHIYKIRNKRIHMFRQYTDTAKFHRILTD
ncbi:MAG: ketosteroid isomerase [Nitrosopumilus sp.]|nr:ketosteroid isomerase [Nitrosopumilus sp.]